MQEIPMSGGWRAAGNGRSALLASILALMVEGSALGGDGPDPDHPFVFAREVWNTPVTAKALRDPRTFAAVPDRSEIVSIPVGGDELGDGFVQRIRGWIEAPATGAYRFAIAADDDAVLYLSAEGDPDAIREVASVTGFTDPARFDRVGQSSRPIVLVKGQRIYVEARHRDVDGDDHLSIAWKVPRSGVDRLVPIGFVIEPRFRFEAWEGVAQADPDSIDAFGREPDRRTAVVDFATPPGIGSSVATRLTGTWIAPRAGAYRFLLSADDRAILEVRSDEEPSRLLGSARLDSWTPPGSWEGRPDQSTRPIRLERGQAVRLEVRHSQGSGPGHAALGVVGPAVDQRPITSPMKAGDS